MSLRVLGRVRLSRSTEESTSVTRQREIITAWAEANEHQIVGWAEDLDVSGSVDPFDTPQLGEWLNNRADQFDVIVCWKLDRITRSAIRLNTLIGWCLDRDKTLVSTTEGIDIGTPVGRLIANVIGFLAEGERDAIRERTSASHRKLRELGRWPGGKPSYGYLAVKTADGWTLEHNPETKPVLKQIIADVLAGKAVEAIAAELTVPNPSGKPGWRPQTIRQMLRSKTLIGHVTHRGATVRDAEGQPIFKAPPVIDLDTWDQLQAVMDGRSRPKTRTSGASAVLGVARCPQGHLLHHRAQQTGGKTYRYYYCRVCGGASLKAEEVEHLLEEEFIDKYGSKPELEKKHIPASNNETALNTAVEAVEELSAIMGTTTSPTVRKALTGQLRALTGRIERLEAQPSQPARVELVPTGRTWGEAWNALDTEGRRQLMLRADMSLVIGPDGWYLTTDTDTIKPA